MRLMKAWTKSDLAWPVTLEQKQQTVDFIEYIQNSPNSSNREKFTAAKLLKELNAQNIVLYADVQQDKEIHINITETPLAPKVDEDDSSRVEPS